MRTKHSVIASLVGAAAVMSAATPASAITIRDDRSQAEYLGAATSIDPFNSIGRLDRNGFLRGAGVLVSENFVLTSAGNVFNAGPGEFEFTFNINGNEYEIASIKIHPKYYNDPINGADLALIELATPVHSSVALPVPVYGGDQELGRMGHLAAPGTSGTGAPGSPLFQDGQFRAGTNTIDIVDDDGKVAWLLTDFDSPSDPGLNQFGSADPTEREFGLASGDFGAPLFIKVGSEYLVAGVASWFTPHSRYGAVNYYTRVSHYGDFFRGCDIIPEIPAPGSAMLAASGLVLLAGRRRNRG